MAEAAPGGTQAVDRAAALLVTVLAAPGPVAYAHLADLSRLPKSTLSRLLASLERNGLLQRNLTGAVLPGPSITDYALSLRPEDDLIRLAQPHLERLGQLTGETVNLAVPFAGEVRQISQVDSTYLLGAVNWLDRPVPFHCSALGRVFLAHGAELPPGRLPRLTDRTITSRSQLTAELHKVAEQGYAVVDAELEPGLVAIAAPVFSADGTVVAAVSVSGPSVRLTSTSHAAVGSAVAETARSISIVIRPTVRAPRKAGAA